eukprot:317177_1
MCLGFKLNGNRLIYHCEIDIRILTLRTITFFQTTAYCSIGRFLIVFLNKYFNAQQIGIIAGSRRGIGFFAAFLWGYIGDCTGKHLLCLISGSLMSTILINGYLFTFIGTNFWYALILSIISTICGKSGCLFDALVILILGQGDTKSYGATRLWGAVGWGFGALLCGALLSKYGESFLFWFYDIINSIPLGIMIISSSYLTIKQYSTHKNEEAAINNGMLQEPIIDKLETEQKHKLNSEQFRKNVFTLYGFIFFGNLLLFGTCMAFVENYLFLFLLNYFNASTVLCGLTIVMMVVGEVPMFHWSKLLLNKIGIIGLLSIAHFAYIIRCVGYTLLPQTTYYSWFILFIEPLHGLTFAGMWIASVEYGSKLAGKDMQGTMQGLIAGIYQSLASSIGTVVGGIIYHHYGPVFMYRLSAVIITAWMIFFQVALRVIRLCDDSRGIKLMFSEVVDEIEESQSDLKKSVAEAPKMCLLVDESDNFDK